MNEQDRLAKLVNDGFDPNAGSDMMAESLRAKLGSVNPGKIDEVRREMEAAASSSLSRKERHLREYLGYPEPTKTASPSPAKDFANVNVESLLIGLYEVYDGLIDVFQRVGLNHEVSDKLTTQIGNVEKCIVKVGGEVKEFIPEDFVSGLEMPNMEENAKRALQNTERCYKLGGIEDASIDDEGSTIRLTFKGRIRDMTYVAIGVIKAGSRGWTGSEAIDYVYKQGGGKMTVRSFEGGKWINCSESYEIKWDLTEQFPEVMQKQQEKPLNSENNSSEVIGDFDIITKDE